MPSLDEAAVAALAGDPDGAINAVMQFKGPYPPDIHPRDVHDTYLVNVLAAVFSRCPDWVCSLDVARRSKDSRYKIVAACIVSLRPELAPVVLARENDSSVYIRDMVAFAIRDFDHIRDAASNRST